MGLSSYLSIFFHDQYHLTKVQAGDYTTFVILFGSFLRPVGGAFADRLGGYRLLIALLAGVGTLYGRSGDTSRRWVCIGFPGGWHGSTRHGQRIGVSAPAPALPNSVGILTGIVGAAGGLGGFLLPSLLGMLKDKTGTFGTGFSVLALLACSGMAALILLRKPWSTTWPDDAATRAGLLAKSPELAENYATSV